MKKILNCLLILFTINIFCTFDVFASSSFTVAECSEPNYIREAPGSSTKLKDVDNEIIKLPTDHKVEILETVDYKNEKWYKIYTNYYSANYTGYIYSGYFKNKKKYTIDSDYEDSLKDKGFPKTYIEPLAKLHSMHPNWNFEVSKYNDGLDWDTAVNEEYDPVYKNLIQNSSDKSLWSTDPSVYSNGEYTVFESYWHAPTKQTISYYMDPRNWLNENTIFMFEQLSYNSKLHTERSVQNILNGTFMEGSYKYKKKDYTYAKTFVIAGEEYNTSPIQLASRVIQEQGRNGSATINMDGDDGKIYYNYFNINAYGSDIVANALATAKANNWDNPYPAILGGAALIANGYTSVGQDTLYYQKFNTINGQSLYNHQYMANVRVLPSEAISMYNSYRNNDSLDSAFTFKIPVYNNMPNQTSLSIQDNAENNLKSLSVTGCDLNPTFYSGATSYTCNVTDVTKSVKVSAKAASEYATVTGAKTYEIKDDVTTIKVVVKAANGNKKTYTITVNKIDLGDKTAGDIISNLGYDNDNNTVSSIPLGTNIVDIDTLIKEKYVATVSFKDINGNKKKKGVVATGDKLIITVNDKKTEFTLKITGDVSSDGNIDISDLAMVKAKLLDVRELEGIKALAADINNDDKIDISDLAMIKAHLLGKRIIKK